MKILCIQFLINRNFGNIQRFTLLMNILFNEFCIQMSYKLDSRSVFLPQNDTYIWIKLNLIWLLCFTIVSFTNKNLRRTGYATIYS